jgi:hypothetical protein
LSLATVLARTAMSWRPWRPSNPGIGLYRHLRVNAADSSADSADRAGSLSLIPRYGAPIGPSPNHSAQRGLTVKVGCYVLSLLDSCACCAGRAGRIPALPDWIGAPSARSIGWTLPTVSILLPTRCRYLERCPTGRNHADSDGLYQLSQRHALTARYLMRDSVFYRSGRISCRHAVTRESVERSGVLSGCIDGIVPNRRTPT